MGVIVAQCLLTLVPSKDLRPGPIVLPATLVVRDSSYTIRSIGSESSLMGWPVGDLLADEPPNQPTNYPTNHLPIIIKGEELCKIVNCYCRWLWLSRYW